MARGRVSRGARPIQRPVPYRRPYRGTTFDPLTGMGADLYAGVDPATDGYSNGAAVATYSLYGTLSGSSLTQGTAGARPTKDTSGAAVPGQPCWTFDGGDFVELTSGVSLAQPFTAIAVLKLGATASLYVAAGLNSANNAYGLGATATPNWNLRMVTADLAGGTPNTSLHCLRGYANGASSTVHVDGSSVASGNAGNGAIDQLIVGAGRTTPATYSRHLPNGSELYALYVVSGQASAKTWWSQFQAYALTRWGVTA